MANTFAPFGFSQFSGTGSAPTYEQVVGFCAYNTAAMYFGDPVFQNANGSIYPTTPGTGILAGVFVGCKYLSVSQKRTVWSNFWGAADVASTNTVEVYYVNDPNAKNTMSGISGAYIDITVTPTTTATLPFKVVGLDTAPPGANGTEAGAYNYAIVAFNNVSTKTLSGI